MKRILFVIIILVMGVWAVGSPTYDKWASKKEKSAEPTIQQYEELITEMENDLKSLRAEKEELQWKSEKDTYVSLWALWKAGMKLERIWPPQDYDQNSIFYLLKEAAVCPSQFQEWLDEALKLDKERNKGYIHFFIIETEL